MVTDIYNASTPSAGGRQEYLFVGDDEESVNPLEKVTMQ